MKLKDDDNILNESILIEEDYPAWEGTVDELQKHLNRICRNFNNQREELRHARNAKRDWQAVAYVLIASWVAFGFLYFLANHFG